MAGAWVRIWTTSASMVEPTTRPRGHSASALCCGFYFRHPDRDLFNQTSSSIVGKALLQQNEVQPFFINLHAHTLSGDCRNLSSLSKHSGTPRPERASFS